MDLAKSHWDALPKQLWTLLTTPNNGIDEGKNDTVKKSNDAQNVCTN